MKQDYHLRRSEKKIEDSEEIATLLRDQELFTLAMCNGNSPYLVSMDYVFDFTRNCFYFHCAQVGKKMDFLSSQPSIWGQILEDLGYIPGKCDHGYRSLQFTGEVVFIEDLSEKREALNLMIEKFEKDPEPAKKRFINEKALKNVVIGKITVKEFSGKKFIPS